MEYSQVVRHRFLVPACKGSNSFTPDYEHPIGSVKNELTTTGEAADCSPRAQPVASQKCDFSLLFARPAAAVSYKVTERKCLEQRTYNNTTPHSPKIEKQEEIY
ncbi:hypothetical protein AgCh_015168 [Apium graveolens]